MMEEKECQFCKTYQRLQEFDKDHYDEKFSVNYYGSLKRGYYDKVNERECGCSEHVKVQLYYCPYCGKKLK